MERRKIFLNQSDDLQLASLDFIDQKMITNYTQDWDYGGERYPGVEYDIDREHTTCPFTVKMGDLLVAVATFKLNHKIDNVPLRKLINAELRGKVLLSAKDARLELWGIFRKKPESKKFSVILTSWKPLANKPQIINTGFKWTLEAQGADQRGRKLECQYKGETNPIKFFVLFGKPRNRFKDLIDTTFLMIDQFKVRNPNDEFTIKRVESSIRFLQENAKIIYDKSKIHEYIYYLMKALPLYAIKSSPLVPSEYASPHYRSPMGYGAWPLLDKKYLKHSAECQALCRLVLGIIEILGMPVIADIVYIYITPDNPSNVKVIVDHDFSREVNTLEKIHLEKKQDWSLVGHSVRIDSNNQINQQKVEHNYYEACLRVRSQGRTVYYPGGIRYPDNPLQGLIHNHSKIIEVFKYLVHTKKDQNKKILQVIDAYDIFKKQWIIGGPSSQLTHIR